MGDGLDWLAGMGDENVTEFGATIRGEGTLQPYLEQIQERLVEVTAAGIVASFGSVLPDVDRAVLAEQSGTSSLSFHEALRVWRLRRLARR